MSFSLPGREGRSSTAAVPEVSCDNVMTVQKTASEGGEQIYVGRGEPRSSQENQVAMKRRGKGLPIEKPPSRGRVKPGPGNLLRSLGAQRSAQSGFQKMSFDSLLDQQSTCSLRESARLP